jgi:molecular chaperone GrpE
MATEAEGQGSAKAEGQAAAVPPGQASREELALLLEDARGKADANWDALLRARAELDNLRRRAARDVENAHKYGIERFVAELLPVKDSLELALAAAAAGGAEADKTREGLDLTLKMLANVFEKFGIEEVDPRGARFDPERHQAMTVQEGTGAEAGTVTQVFQKGYLLNQRLVRPAMVVVAR